MEEVPCLDGPGAHRLHVWMGKIDSMFGWTRHSWRISAKLLCPWLTAIPKEEASLALLPPPAAANFVGKKKGKKLTKHLCYKNFSTYLVPLSTENWI